VIAILILDVSTQVSAIPRQTPGRKVLNSKGRDYIGGNKIISRIPEGYEDFLLLWVDSLCICRKNVDCDDIRGNLTPDRNGRIAVCGRVVFKQPHHQGGSDSDDEYLSYEFAEAHLIDIRGKPIQLVIRTKQRDGISYRFIGEYFEKPQTDVEGSRIHMKGKMTKLKDQRLISKTEIAFTPYNIIE
jgi:hypothetical protein